jgi:ligand-binding SRPBCC domain-containing protein
VSRGTKIDLQTLINAPVERCFDLARSIDLHIRSAERTRERAVVGVVSGLIAEGQEVEWKARHFGIWLRMRIRITGYERPHFFQDSMVDGPFSHFCHDHTFDNMGSGTMMTDHIVFSSPVPLAGELLDRFVIRKHLQDFVEERNKQLKAAAESELWRQYLSVQNP